MAVELVRKNIKNVHLSVLPPEGRVRLSAPFTMSEDSARLAVVTRWGWIKKKQKEYARQKRETQRDYVDGETHYFDGHKYLLSVVEESVKASVKVRGNGRIELCCRQGASREVRQRAFDAFYRSHLQTLIETKIAQYCAELSVIQPTIRIQRMRTKWGSCASASQRILINLEMAKKPTACVEYILAHELVHLRVRRHNEVFKALLEGILPDWSHRRDILNSYPLAFDEWSY
ncbi:MAG: SprT family zinc-dependent metalloprotease [Tateyamaria sp.]|uniref:M48 family metallopeptidase n=1 Tax=Tateyamaria sp. TaxID=1929288 RepID=UPI00329BBADE